MSSCSSSLCNSWKNVQQHTKKSASDDLEKPHQDFGQMPAPMSFKASQKQRATLTLSKQQTMIVVSSFKPYRILSISERLASLLEYAPSLLSGRSISSLQGPKTHSAALDCAIRNANFEANVQIPFLLYSSSGAEHEVLMHCIPLFDESGKMYACALDTRFDSSEERVLTANSTYLEGEKKIVDSKQGLLHLHQQQMLLEYRKLYNFRTGLSIHKAFRHHQLKILADASKMTNDNDTNSNSANLSVHL